MVRRLPSLNALRAFEAAGRHESFTGAAGELNVSHAAISRHIRGLEERLNVQLFRPVARGVRLTEAGCRYLKALSPAFDQIAEATEEISGPQHTRITLSCEPTFAVKWLMPRLAGFHEANAGLEVTVDASTRVVDIERYECDVAIRYFDGEAKGIALDTICRTAVYPYGARSLKGRRRKPFAPEEILKLGLLNAAGNMTWKRWFACAGLPDAEIDGPVALSGLGTLMSIQSALAGQGVVLLSEELVEDDVKDGRLVRLSNVGLREGGYYLVYLPEALRRTPIRAFRDWVLAESAPLRAGG